MKRMSLRILAVLVLAAGVALPTVYLLRPSEPPPVSGPDPETTARLKRQRALRDAPLLDLIRNARVATRKGDRVTREAMLTGLKRESHRARALIESEISKSSDSVDIGILNRMKQELP